jgi:hypothetical protein
VTRCPWIAASAHSPSKDGRLAAPYGLLAMTAPPDRIVVVRGPLPES